MSQDKEREDSDELLSCPFCGHDEATMTVNEFRDHYITCDNCEADGPWQHTKEAAIVAWNTRAALASQQAVKGEPYAHIVELPAGEYAGTVKFFTAPSDPRGRPVYLHQPSPPSREVEPLTDEQKKSIYEKAHHPFKKPSLTQRVAYLSLIAAVEAAYGIHSREGGSNG